MSAAKPVSTPSEASDSRAAPVEPRRLVSSCSGRILHMLFVLAGGLLVGEPCPAEALLRAARLLPRISIVAHRARLGRIDDLLRTVGRSDSVEVIAASDSADLWGWAQDRCLVCVGARSGAPILVHGATIQSRDTARWALEAREDSRALTTELRLEGGNILTDGDICFVGADLADDNVDFAARFAAEIESSRAIEVIGGSAPLPRRGPSRFATTPADLRWREATDRSLSRPGTRQPVFHLDMFMTLAGRGSSGRLRVLVGDPLQASKLIGLPLPKGVPLGAFDEIAANLVARGHEVIRNPLPFIHFDDPEARMREWFYASANNCWVEWRPGGGSRVWLPQYGFGDWPELKATDAANAAIWQALGFEVIPVGDFLPLVDELGSLNCASKVLERADG